MARSPDTIEIPPDHAVAAVDGSVSRHGASAGVVLIHAGSAHLIGTPLPDVDQAWLAEACAVRVAIDAAFDLGVSNLRLLIDHHNVAQTVQGRPPTRETGNEATLSLLMAQTRARGLKVSARVVQGHAETSDLPSRMNDLAHILGDVGSRQPFLRTVDATTGWIDRLASEDARFKPTWTPQRWAAFLQRRRTAHFLGVDVLTVDRLVKAGHVDYNARGVSRESAAKVYVRLQEMRHDAYFGFEAPEHEPGRWEDEILSGWDGRLAQFYHRKSGMRPPTPVQDLVEADEETPAPAM